VREEYNACTYVKSEDECYCVFVDEKDRNHLVMERAIVKIQKPCDFYETDSQLYGVCTYYDPVSCRCECQAARWDRVSISKLEDV